MPSEFESSLRRRGRIRVASRLLIVCLAALPNTARAMTSSNVASTESDSSDVIAVVAKFHAALAAADSGGALELLAPDALILESGSVETRAEYRAHHLAADIEFTRAVRSSRTTSRVTVDGDAAWLVSTSVTQGEINGRQVNSAGAELVVLHRVRGKWQISAVHWSSRARRTSG